MRPFITANVLLLALFAAFSARAAIYTVNTFAYDEADLVNDDGICDVRPGPANPGNQCTLRGALNEAAVGNSVDTILIPPGAHIMLDLTNPAVDQNVVGDLDIPYSVVIECNLCIGAPVSEYPVIDAGGLGERAFDSTAVSLALRRLVIRNGFASAPQSGGALRADGTQVTVEYVRFENNAASGMGGAISVQDDTLIIVGSDFVDNIGNVGGAVHADSGEAGLEYVTIERSSFRDNQDITATPKSQIHVTGNLSTSVTNTHIEGGNGGFRGLGLPRIVFNSNTVVNTIGNGIAASVDASGELFLANSILAGNTVDCVIGGGGVADAVLHHMLIEDATCTPPGSTNITGQDPLLNAMLESSPMIPVQWRSPLLASPVTDSGSTAGDEPSCPGSDIRAAPRPADSDDAGTEATCDIGAVEAQFESLHLIVNRLDDALDFNPDDGVCDVLQFTAGDQCTLRAAIQTANASPGIDLIQLPPGVISLARPGTDEDPDTIVDGDLDITESVIIAGPGAKSTSVQCCTNLSHYRVFDIDIPTPGQTVTMFGFAIEGGNAGDKATAVGGAIRVASDTGLVLGSMRFEDNSAGGAGGAVAVAEGDLYIVATDFNENQAPRGAAIELPKGGFLEATLTKSSIRNSTSAGDYASAIFSGGGAILRVSNSTLSNNAGAAIQSSAADLFLKHVTISSVVDGSVSLKYLAADNSTLSIINSVFDSVQSNCSFSYGGAVGVTLVETGNFQGQCVIGVAKGGGGGPAQPAGGILTAPQPVSTDPASFAESWVQLPTANSPLLDNADPLEALADDQRGLARPIDGDVDGQAEADIGAVELVPDKIFSDGFETYD